jgi:hypothetical protein
MAGALAGLGALNTLGQYANVKKGNDQHFLLYMVFGLLFGCCLAISMMLWMKDYTTMSDDAQLGTGITFAVCFGLSSCALFAWIMQIPA